MRSIVTASIGDFSVLPPAWWGSPPLGRAWCWEGGAMMRPQRVLAKRVQLLESKRPRAPDQVMLAFFWDFFIAIERFQDCLCCRCVAPIDPRVSVRSVPYEPTAQRGSQPKMGPSTAKLLFFGPKAIATHSEERRKNGSGEIRDSAEPVTLTAPRGWCTHACTYIGTR